MTEFYSIDFAVPETVEQLAAYVGLRPEFLKMAIEPDLKTGLYHRHRIPKRNPRRPYEERIVWEAMPPWLDAHKIIARRFDLFARVADARFPHPSACGFVRYKSTKENAAPHCGAPLLMRADIRNFFPSISLARLVIRFQSLGMHDEAAMALANFVTIEGGLALGLCASPMLANLISVDLDLKLTDLASRYGCKYTRYADDISISGREQLPSRKELEELLVTEQFSLAGEKFRITKNGQAHFVTGLSVSDPSFPHVPRGMKRKLRQELYYAQKFGIREHLRRIREEKIQRGINRLDGTVRYVGHIEVSRGDEIRKKWKFLLQRDYCSPSYEQIPSEIIQPNTTCYIDETEISFGGENFLALGLVFTQSPRIIEETTLAILHKFEKADPFYAGDRGALTKSGVHFVDAHFDLRAAYINTLESLPFRAFIIFGKLTDPEKYQEVYMSLLKSVLPLRLVKYGAVMLNILVEQNSKIRAAVLESTIEGVYQDLAHHGSRRPIVSPNVKISSKKDVPAFSVPDFMLAIFSRYAQSKSFLKEPLREHQFERLRDRYRLIIDADSGIEYSRRRPFMPWSPRG